MNDHEFGVTDAMVCILITGFISSFASLLCLDYPIAVLAIMSVWLMTVVGLIRMATHG